MGKVPTGRPRHRVQNTTAESSSHRGFDTLNKVLGEYYRDYDRQGTPLVLISVRILRIFGH